MPMFALQSVPPGWTGAKMAAFNALLEAAFSLFMLNAVRNQVGNVDPAITALQTELRDHVASTLLPAFRDA